MRPLRSRAPRVGIVASYEAERGLGTVETGGAAPLGFHCTAITDGTRTIEPGTRVAFIVVPALGGCFEAAEISPLSSR